MYSEQRLKVFVQVFGKCQIFSEEPHMLISSVPQLTVGRGRYKEKNKAEAFSVMGWSRGWWRRAQTLELMARERSFPGRILPLILVTFWMELPTEQRIIGRLKPSRETGKMSLFQLLHYVWLFLGCPCFLFLTHRGILSFNGFIYCWTYS